MHLLYYEIDIFARKSSAVFPYCGKFSPFLPFLSFLSCFPLLIFLKNSRIMNKKFFQKELFMKKIKTTLAAFLAALTLLPLAACGNDLPETDQGDSSSASTPLPPAEEPEIDEEENNPSEEETTPEKEPEPVPAVDEYFRCTADNVNLRAGAGTSYAIVGSAEKNTSYAIIGKTGNWYKTYYRGKIAYFYAEYAAVFSIEQSENERVEEVLDYAYATIGVPYVYGAVRLHDGKGNFLKGFTAQKFDCSSLVQYAFYYGADELLDVTTRTQFVQGEKIKKSELSRGDCMYFTNDERRNRTGIERVGHVAIYLGNDYILHTASDYARIEKMTAKRWNYYIEARRFT
jgi:cell wall-associated NlpC family hydrolase